MERIRATVLILTLALVPTWGSAYAQEKYCEADGKTQLKDNDPMLAGLDPAKVNEYTNDAHLDTKIGEGGRATSDSQKVLICDQRNGLFAEFSMCLGQQKNLSLYHAQTAFAALKNLCHDSCTLSPPNLAAALAQVSDPESSRSWPSVVATFSDGNASIDLSQDRIDGNAMAAIGQGELSNPGDWNPKSYELAAALSAVKAEMQMQYGLKAEFASKFPGKSMKPVTVCKDYLAKLNQPHDNFKPFGALSDVPACMKDLTSCGKGPGSPCCTSDDPTMAALLNQDVSKVNEQYGVGVKPEDLANDYVHELRRTAIDNLLHAQGQILGTYDPDVARDWIDPGMRDKIIAACNKRGDIGAMVRSKFLAPNQLSQGDKAANDFLMSDAGKRALASAAVDLFRQRWLYADYSLQCGGHSGPDYQADPSCPCLDDTISSFKDVPFGTSGAGGMAACTGAGYKSDCCSAWWKNPGSAAETNGLYPNGCIKDERACKEAANAKAKMLDDIRKFPLLSAGLNDSSINDPEAIFKWVTRGGEDGKGQFLDETLPIVKSILANQVSGPPYHMRSMSVDKFDSAAMGNTIAKARKMETADFAQAIDKLCEDPSAGGPDAKDLLQMPAIVQQVLKAHPEYVTVQECARRSIASDAKYKAAGEFALGLGCLVGGILTAGAVAPACSIAFAGIAAVDYGNASHQADLMSRCFTAGGAANICTGSDQIAAENAKSAAACNLAFNAAFAIVDASGLQELIASASEARAVIEASEASMTPAEMEEVSSTLESAKNWGNNPTEAANAIENAKQEAQAIVQRHHEVVRSLAAAEEQGAPALSKEILQRLPDDIASDPAIRQEVQGLSEDAVSSGRDSKDIGKIIDRDLGECIK